MQYWGDGESDGPMSLGFGFEVELELDWGAENLSDDLLEDQGVLILLL